ncbi:hypothetical protein HY992_01820 [Candidatus Micrarchaeota archaeon]|nr:hypothetical protein [Candidatus Micrarchaeota archaeon]
MVRQDLVDFVVSWLKEGQEIEDIRAALSNGGYSQNEINDVVITASEKYTSQLKAVKFGKLSKLEKPAKKEAKEEKKEEREEKKQERGEQKKQSREEEQEERAEQKKQEREKESREEKQEQAGKPALFETQVFKGIEETVSKATEEMRLLHAQGARHVPPKERRPQVQEAMIPEINVSPPSNLPYILGFAIILLAVAGAAYFVYTALSSPSTPTGAFALVPADSNMVMYMDMKKLYSDADIKDAMKEYYKWISGLSSSLADLPGYSASTMPIYNESLLNEEWQESENYSSVVVFMNMDRLVTSVNATGAYSYPYKSAPKNLSFKGIGVIIKVKGNAIEKSAKEIETQFKELGEELNISSRDYNGLKVYSLNKWPDYNALIASSTKLNSSNPFASYNSTYNPFEAYDVNAFAWAVLDSETIVFGTIDEVEAVIDVKNGQKQSFASRADFQEISKDIDATALFSMVFVLNEEELNALAEKYPPSSSSSLPSELKELKFGFSIDKNGDPISAQAVFFAPNATAAEKAVDAGNGAIKIYRGMTAEGSAAEAIMNGAKLSSEGVKLKFSFETSVTQIKALVEEFKKQQRDSLLKQIEECNSGDFSSYYYTKDNCYSFLLYSITNASDCALITDEVWSAKCIAYVSVKTLEDLGGVCNEFASQAQKDACVSHGVASLINSDWLKAKNYSSGPLYTACSGISSSKLGDDCFNSVARYSHDILGCERISNSSIADACFNSRAYDTLNSTLCKSILNSTTRKSCEKYATWERKYE